MQRTVGKARIDNWAEYGNENFQEAKRRRFLSPTILLFFTDPFFLELIYYLLLIHKKKRGGMIRENITYFVQRFFPLKICV